MTHLESVRCLWSLAAVDCVEAVAERPETPRDGLSLVSAGDLNSLHPRPGVPLLLLLMLMLLVVPGPAPASSQALPAQTADLPSGLIVSKHCLVFAASTPADTGHHRRRRSDRASGTHSRNLPKSTKELTGPIVRRLPPQTTLQLAL